MDKKIISTAAFFGMTAIILGAFGAHALKKVLTLEELVSFETGVRYQMYHALFLLFIGLILLGIVFFSGSIYLLSTTSISKIDFKIIGFVTPIGGALLIMAWAILVYQFTKKKDKS